LAPPLAERRQRVLPPPLVALRLPGQRVPPLPALPLLPGRVLPPQRVPAQAPQPAQPAQD